MSPRSLIQNLAHKGKQALKGLPPVAAINSAFKARQLRCDLRRLQERYAAQAARRGYAYSDDAAIEEFRRRLSQMKPGWSPRQCGGLRIFWVGANRDQDESGFLQGLRRIAEVIEFQDWKGTYGLCFTDSMGRVQTFDREIVAANDRCLQSQIEDALRGGELHLLMGQMWANFISKEALGRVRRLGIPVLNISMDDRLPVHWNTNSGTRLGAVGLGPETDLILTTCSETCTWYGVEGYPAIFWPLASDPEVFCPPQNSVRDIDVLFIGNKYGVRESIISELHRRGVKVECYGAGWPNGPATAEQSAALYKRAKIILGVGTVGHCADVYTMKLRDFDAPMAGALYLTHRCPDLALMYREGCEIECYSKAEEAASKIRYYLARPDELSRVANAGFNKAVSRDTWINRLRGTFESLGLVEKGEV